MRPTRFRPTAFTLVELLVVIGIIAVLISILLPSLNRARDAAKQTQCLSNIRTVGTALQAYVIESKQILPPHVPWPDSNFYQGVPNFGNDAVIATNPSVLGVLLPYFGNQRKVLVCPTALEYYGSTAFNPTEESDTNYLSNGVVCGVRISRIPKSSDVVILQEDKYHFNTSFIRPNVAGAGIFNSWTIYFPGTITHEYGNSHFRGGNYLFLDGHAEYRKINAMHARDFALTGGAGVDGTADDLKVDSDSANLKTYRASFQ